MKRLTLAVSLAASMWACDESTPTSPTEPRTEPPRATYTLSGVVSDVEHAPVAGARVEESTRHLIATTDTRGSYRIVGLYAGPTAVSVSSEAHETVTRNVAIDGDTRLDIQVVRRPSYTLSGVVSEMTSTGPVPVEGVHVEWGDDHLVSMTDTKGFYSIAGVYAGNTSVIVNKEGFEDGRRDVTVNGDTRFDIQLVRR